jgi:hypothetical protein
MANALRFPAQRGVIAALTFAWGTIVAFRMTETLDLHLVSGCWKMARAARYVRK